MTSATQTFDCAAAVSQAEDPRDAGRQLAQRITETLGTGPIDLAFMFFSAHYAEAAPALSQAFRDELDPQVVLGCTGEGVITEDQEIEGGRAVTVWAARLPGVRLTPLRLSSSSEDRPVFGTGWTGDLGSANERPVFILLADPFSTPMSEVFSMIAGRWPGATAIGGLAGGGRDSGENRMLLNEEVYDGGLVGVALAGAVNIRTVISQGCRPVGERYVVTRAEHNVIHELGGKPALEQLQSVFHSLSPTEQRLAHQALHLGIVIDEHKSDFERGDFLVRNLIGADRGAGSLAIGEIVQEGQTVQFHVRDADAASEDLSELVARDHARHRDKPLGALLFSCCGRGRGLFGRPDHDVSVVRKELGGIPLAGFFAQGEIGPVGTNNYLHGYTASLALFCRSNEMRARSDP